jgi:Transcriptional regulators containing a DNA-binding HTH domain and an aminotransferase domain (MocR family) and their eukaryotic orthologs
MIDFPTDHSSSAPFGIEIDRSSSASLVHQVADGLRSSIRTGRLSGGLRLPSTRDLATELGVSRSVTVEAYEQLEAEGYLEGRIGSGSYVVEGAAPAAGVAAIVVPIAAERQGAYRGRSFYRRRRGPDLVDFDGACASHEPELFPREEWARCLSLACRGRAGSAGYGFGDIAGDRALRRAVAAYLFRMKGLACAEDELIITSGSSQAALLLGTLLRDRYPAIQVEDPTYPPLRAILRRQGLRLRPIAVDGYGLRPEPIDGGLPLLATPAHHFPTGALLSAERREAIAARLRSGGSIAIEDDYDGELRLRGLPIAPLRAIAPDRVVLMGSFSKVMYPGLRIGYLAAPENLVDRLLGIKFGLALWADGLAQTALARFIDEGHLDRRVRRIKKSSASKRELVEELAGALPGGPAIVRGEACGMHCALAFPSGLPARFNPRETEASGFVASPLSSFSILPQAGREEALLIGYGALGEERIREGFARMGAYLHHRALGRSSS